MRVVPFPGSIRKGGVRNGSHMPHRATTIERTVTPMVWYSGIPGVCAELTTPTKDPSELLQMLPTGSPSTYALAERCK